MSHPMDHSETESGLLDGVKFWVRLLAEGVAILAASVLAFFLARPIWTAATGNAGTGFAMTWFLLTVAIMIWYRQRRLKVGY